MIHGDEGLQNWNIIHRNELKIRTNSQKGTGTKIAEKLSNFENFERKKNQISALFLTQRPPDDWPDALDHLVIGFVAKKYTKLGKTSEIFKITRKKFFNCERSDFFLVTYH